MVGQECGFVAIAMIAPAALVEGERVADYTSGPLLVPCRRMERARLVKGKPYLSHITMLGKTAQRSAGAR